jgi:tetratricopeptide (TPR) repeat protein
MSLLALLCTLALWPPAAAADALGDGKKALERGDAKAAVDLLTRAVAEEPERAEAHLALGQALEQLGRYEEALAAYDAARRLDPRSSEAERGRGACLWRLGRKDDGVTAYRAAMDLNHKFPRAGLELAALLTEMGRPEEAVEVCQQGVKWGKDVRPYFEEAWGKAELARGNGVEAEKHVLQARELAPANPRFHRALGDLYLERKVPQLAILSYQAAVDLDPNDVESRYAMARALEREARYNEALDQYKAVIAHNPAYADAYRQMGHLYLLASERTPAFVGEAVENLEKYHALVPEDSQGTILLASAYYKARRRDEAKALLDPLADRGALDAEGHLTYGRLSYESRDFAAAAEHLPLAGRLLEEVDVRRLAHAYTSLGELAQADSLYLARFEADSAAGVSLAKASNWLLESAKLHFRQGRQDTTEYWKALPLLGRKLALDPESEEAFYYQGLCLRELNRTDEAVAPLEKAVQLAPDKADRYFWLAATYLKLEQTDPALEAFERTAALDDSSTLGAIARQRIGYEYLLRKDYGRACEELERSAAIDPKQVQTWVWLGQCQQNSGRREAALEAYRKALALDPNQADAKKGIQQLSQ